MRCAVKLLLLLILLALICPTYYGQNTDSVVTEWVQRFNYCDTCLTNVDEAHHIGIDAQGNVYSGGYSTTTTGGTYTNFDFCVIKYSPSGEQLWDARYDGAQHSQDLLYDMKVDDSGNVYATGPSLENDHDNPVYTTVKWNSDGVQQWVAHYNGTYQTSRSWAISIDAAGNSYVTGSSLEGSQYVMATVKYDPSGVQQWVSKYSVSPTQEGVAIVTDNIGNVYVAGRIYTNGNNNGNDYITIKYNSAGVEQWHQIYDGAIGRDDIPTAIVLDSDQNIYVTGRSKSQGLNGYWDDFCTIKYNPAGDQQWIARYDGPIHGPDDSRGIIYDQSTNSIVVTGSSYYNTSFSTFLTIKYNISTGDTIWTARYYTPFGSHDGANAITNDVFGSIYIIGGSIGNGTLYDYATVKYDQGGRQQWVRRYDGAQGLDYGYDIAADNTGSVFVTGTSPVPGTGPDYLTIKYSDITTFQLSVDVNAGWNMVSVPGINPDGQGVANWWPGRTGDVYKYSSGYQIISTTTPTEGYWMKNTSAQTYNTGDEWPAGGIEIVAHDPITGNAGWNLIGGYENSATVSAITTNPPGLQQGAVYGYSSGYTTPATMDPGYGYWIKLSAAGDIILPNAISKSNAKVADFFKDDWGKIIVTDKAGRSYTLYAVKGEVDLNQYEMPPAPPAGMFDIRFGSGRIAEDINNSIQSIDMSGVEYPIKVRVEGMDIRLQDQTGKEINQNVKAGEEVMIGNSAINKLMVSGQLIPDKYSLDQNYPNPFNPSTTIEFSLPENVKNVKLTIYNVLGQKVTELVNTSLDAGKYVYQWNAKNVATGLYIYELRTDKFVAIKKMMLLK